MRKILTLVPIVFLSIGCVGTAHRVISEGSMKDQEAWEIRGGGGRSGTSYKSTTFISNKLSINVLPCNYEQGYSGLILPVPMPLGTQPGIEEGNQFLLGVTIYSPQDFDAYPIRTRLIIGDKEYLPTKISENGATCELNNSRVWQTENESYVTKTKKQHESLPWKADFTIWYDIATPSTDTNFMVSFSQLYQGDESIMVPTMYFTKGSSWGGW